jgi:uncharacterized membrane protein (UPF0127 family)
LVGFRPARFLGNDSLNLKGAEDSSLAIEIGIPCGGEVVVEKAGALSQPWLMKISWLLLLLLGASIVGCQKQAPAQKQMAVTNAEVASMVAGWPPTKAQPRLPTTKLFIGKEEVNAELALTRIQVMTGMMFRTNMLEQEGMLFAFPDAQPRSFYMKNTKVPLTLAYIEPDGTILELHDLKPLEESPVFSKSDRIQFVLEMNQGWFSRHGIGTGTVVATERGSLRDFFGIKR